MVPSSSSNRSLGISRSEEADMRRMAPANEENEDDNVLSSGGEFRVQC